MVICFLDNIFLEPLGLIISLLSFIMLSSILMFFYDRIFLIDLILKEDSSYFLGVLVKVTFLYSSNLALGNLTARNLRTLGHLIGSISFTSPSSALKDDKLASIPLRIAVSRS